MYNIDIKLRKEQKKEIMIMKIKEWIYDKIQDDARRYNRFIDVADTSRNEV